MKSFFWRFCLAAVCWLGIASAAAAQDELSEPLAEPDELMQRIEDLEQQVRRLSAAPRFSEAGAEEPLSDNTSILPASSYAPGDPATPAPAKPSSPVPPPIKYPTVQINGFFQADAVFFNQDDTSRETVGDIQDGAGFRRTRLSAKGQVAENIAYIIQMDFGFFGRPTFTDVYTDIQQVPLLGNVRIGQWKQPFSLEVATSVRYQPFMERSLLFQSFAPFRHIGIGFYDWSEDQRTTWSASVFRTGNDQYGDDTGDDGGFSTAGRATHLLWYDQAYGETVTNEGLDYLHLGGAYWFGDPSKNVFRYATIPEMFVGEFSVPGGTIPGNSKVQVPTIAIGTPPFVDTGIFATSNFTHLGTELLWVRGPFSIQSEAQVAMVNRIGAGQVVFPGAYAEMTYFLTGESRPYDRKAGALDRVVPKCAFLTKNGEVQGMGAWEFAMRASYVKLTDKDIQGGRLFDLTCGLNWYMTGNAKIQLNYVRAFLDAPAVGKSGTDIFGMRCQVDF